MNKLVAIVGMCGSGKSIASEYFCNKGYKKVYLGGITISKLKENNLEINPDNERMMREDLRKKYGMAAYALLSLDSIDSYLKDDNVVIDGLYSWDELKVFKDKYPFIKVISIIIDKDIRYDRLESRDFRPLTFNQAVNRDVTEIENLAKAGPIAFADYYVLNNGSLSDYYGQLEKIDERLVD